MRLYAIDVHQVEDALDNPDEMRPGKFGAQHAWKQDRDGPWLRVTFRIETERRVVITVTPRKTLGRDPDAN